MQSVPRLQYCCHGIVVTMPHPGVVRGGFLPWQPRKRHLSRRSFAQIATRNLPRAALGGFSGQTILSPILHAEKGYWLGTPNSCERSRPRNGRDI
jgi:hypothetical protein